MNMQVISTESQGDSRTQRSKLARRISHTLEEFLVQRAFQHLHLGKVRVGRLTHRILWHQDRVYRFVVDFDAGAVTIPSLLPATLSPQLLRELRGSLRPVSSSGSCERTQLDPEKGELRVFLKHGSLTLSITVRNDAYEYCTQQLVRLADDVLKSFPHH